MYHSRTLPLAGLVLALPVAGSTEIERFNPQGLSQPDGYSQVVIARNPGRFIYLGGKAGIRPDQSFPKTLAEQSRQTFANIDQALKAAGAGREDVVEIAIYIVGLEDLGPNPVYEDVRNFFPAGHKPASMVIGVSALAYPGLLVEINVRAVYGITLRENKKGRLRVFPETRNLRLLFRFLTIKLRDIRVW